jgi:hypothetical protein
MGEENGGWRHEGDRGKGCEARGAVPQSRSIGVAAAQRTWSLDCCCIDLGGLPMGSDDLVCLANTSPYHFRCPLFLFFSFP